MGGWVLITRIALSSYLCDPLVQFLHVILFRLCEGVVAWLFAQTVLGAVGG